MPKRLTDFERMIRDSVVMAYPHDDTSPAAVVRNWLTAGGRNPREHVVYYLDSLKSSEIAAIIKANWDVEASAEAILAAVVEVRGEYA